MRTQRTDNNRTRILNGISASNGAVGPTKDATVKVEASGLSMSRGGDGSRERLNPIACAMAVPPRSKELTIVPNTHDFNYMARIESVGCAQDAFFVMTRGDLFQFRDEINNVLSANIEGQARVLPSPAASGSQVVCNCQCYGEPDDPDHPCVHQCLSANKGVTGADEGGVP